MNIAHTDELMEAEELQTSRSETEVSGEAKEKDQDGKVNIESTGDEGNQTQST